MNRIENQTLALAGMFQAAVLVEALASGGQCNRAALDCSVDSLFTFDAASALEVFGDTACLGIGFDALVGYLGGHSRQSSRNVAYYVMSMLKLATRLQRNPALAETLHRGLTKAESGQRDFDLPREQLIGHLDRLYQDNISPLQPRIMVRGEPACLRDAAVAARIRALLLAGIRAAVLWQQLGGSRWRLLLARRHYVDTARRLREPA